MKKILVIASVAVIALVIFGAGFYFAQANVVNAAGLTGMMGGYGGGMMGTRGGMLQVHEYVEQALADKLEITKSDVESAFDGGKSMAQIAIDHGIKSADVPALLAEVHKTAFASAVKDGILTQAQADAMLQRMSANGYNAQGGMMNGQRGGMMNGANGQRGGMMSGWNTLPTSVP